MKTAILTIIKDEQKYLQQWLEYHFNIGISTIFVIEDFGSSSHREICNKFPNVKLYSAADVFYNAKDVEWARDLKKQGKGIQHILHGLAFGRLKKTDIDWLFIIDIDEFITISSQDTLKSILGGFQEYDGVKLAWHNFNAAGRFYAPKFPYDPTEIYTERCGYSEMDIKRNIIGKLCFNLKKENCKFFNHHNPVPKSNFTETDKLYIRHYITRSFEEYLWKINVRGMCYKTHRDINEFFVYNPKMRNDPKIAEIQQNINNLQYIS